MTTTEVDDCVLSKHPVGSDELKAERKAMIRILNRTGSGVISVMACGNDRCLSPYHVVSSQSDVGRLLYIKNHVTREGDCLVWTGKYDHKVPSYPYRPNGQKFNSSCSVRRFVYNQEHGTYGQTDGVVRHTCGTVGCVSHKHLVHEAAPVSGLCPEGHKLQKTNINHCHSCVRERDKYRECSRGHWYHLSHGCDGCRSEDAAEFIRERNAEALKAPHL